MRFSIETEREQDGRWIAEIVAIPGAHAYGETEAQAKANAYAIALRAYRLATQRSVSIISSSRIS
jgi:predicted RNase H-like HicB family nuclease